MWKVKAQMKGMEAELVEVKTKLSKMAAVHDEQEEALAAQQERQALAPCLGPASSDEGPQVNTTPPVCDVGHRQGMTLAGAPPDGKEEQDLYAWGTHLESILYQDNTNKYRAVFAALRPNWHNYKVTACRSQANRFYLIQCRQCSQCAYGEYGSWNSVTERETAQNNLVDFLGPATPKTTAL